MMVKTDDGRPGQTLLTKESKSPAWRETPKQSMRFSNRRSQSSSKAQYSVVYLLAISGILLFLMGMVFIMASAFQKTTTEQFGRELLEGVAAKIETGLIEFKELSKDSNSSSANINIPELIGDQRYFVTASGKAIELRTFGNPSLVKNYNMTFWNATLRGAVFSSGSKIHLSYNGSASAVTFS